MGGTRQQPKSLARQAGRYTPSAGIFGPTTGLDHSLFDEHARLRPEVAEEIMQRLDRCIRVDSGLAGSDWQDWTRVYLLGGSASEWAGDRPNDAAQDLDVIVAIDLPEAQRHNAFEGMNAGEAASALNAAFWKHFNAERWQAPFGGTWDLTAFCNQRAWDITAIKPYAAWDLTHGTWAMTPPHLPEHTIADFHPAVIAHARAVAAEARAILRMDEPLRTREAKALWDRIHAGRSTAFSDQGQGWQDSGNVVEKWLAYAPRHLLGRIKELAFAKTAVLVRPLPEDFAHEVYGNDTSDFRLHGDSYILHNDRPRRIVAYSRGKDLVAPGQPNYTRGHQQPSPVGYLSWLSRAGDSPPEIYKTVVDEKHRRRGVASAMLDFAREMEPDLQHSHALTQDGRAWAEKIAAAQGYLRNPYHGTPEFGGRDDWSHTWFHGTRGEPEFGTRRKDSDEARRAALPPDQRKMNFGWTQPNQHLGVHFSPLHEVAHKFTGSVSSQPGSLVHARLRFDNPAVFPSEEHLNIAMTHWASQHYPHWHDDKLNGNMAWNYGDQEGTHRDYSQVPDDSRERWKMSQKAQSLLQWHPHMPEILAGFRQHLAGQGHHGIIYGNSLEGPYETDAGRGGEATTKYIKKRENWPAGHPYSFSAIARPDDIEVTHVEHISPWREEPQPHQRTWEDASDQDEPDEMRDKVLGWHRQHGGALPSKLGRREEQLAAMDPHSRASALAQEHVRLYHPKLMTPLSVKSGQSSVVLTSWLAAAGHPRAGDAYVAMHRDPGSMQSNTGRGPDGEPAVILHPDRWDYGTMAHETAHLITDLETGRPHRGEHGPDGAHDDHWAGNYAKLLENLSPGAGDDFLAQRDAEQPMRREAAVRETKSDALPSGAGMVYLSVPHGKIEGADDHVTLAYLPRNMSDEHFDRVSEIARDAAQRHQRFRGVFGGGGTFPAGADRTKKRTAFIPLDAPAAHPLQKEFAEVNRSHYPTYSPHVTRAYLKPGDEDPAPHPDTWVNFTHVHVRRGDEVRSFALRAPEEDPGAPENRWRRPDKHRPQQRAEQAHRLDTERWKAQRDEDQRQTEIEDRTLKPWARGEGMQHEAVSGYDGLTGRTAMIYLELPPGAVRPVPGGVDDHHITLVYLGKNVSDKKFAEACRRAKEAAAVCPPMDGVLRGIDIFPPSKSSDGKVPAFVPAYVGGIGRLRRLLEDLSASEHKDYRPHVSLAYLEEGDSLPAPHPAVPLRFTRVHVKRGDEVVSFPLTGGASG